MLVNSSTETKKEKTKFKKKKWKEKKQEYLLEKNVPQSLSSGAMAWARERSYPSKPVRELLRMEPAFSVLVKSAPRQKTGGRSDHEIRKCSHSKLKN